MSVEVDGDLVSAVGDGAGGGVAEEVYVVVAEVAVLGAGDDGVADVEAFAVDRDGWSGEGAVGGEEGLGAVVELAAYGVGFGHHPCRVAGVVESVGVPVGGEVVEEFVGGGSGDDALVVGEACEGLGDESVAVVGVGESDVGHLRCGLASVDGERRCGVGDEHGPVGERLAAVVELRDE